MRDINLTDDYDYENNDVNIDVYDDMCGCPEVLVNFKEETLNKIKELGKTVKEYYLKADLEIQSDTEEVVHENFATGETEFIDIILKGKGDIDWSKVKDEYLDYDDGYGSQVWSGWVSFTDGTWIERHEYDGSEWWEYKETPSLDNIEEESEMEEKDLQNKNDVESTGKWRFVNFKEETLEEINKLNKTVKEYYFQAEIRTDPDTGEIIYDYDEEKETVLSINPYYGKGTINWDEVKEEYLNYPKSFKKDGIWYGWISFTDGTWMERFNAEPTNTEWWDYKEIPDLDTYLAGAKEYLKGEK